MSNKLQALQRALDGKQPKITQPEAGVTSARRESYMAPSREGKTNITAYLAPDAQSVVGFSGQDAYAYCHLDGSYALLCPGILSGGTPGAACPRLPPPPPALVGCADPLAVHPSTADANAVIIDNLLMVGEPINLQASHASLLSVHLYTASGSLVAEREARGPSLSLPTSGLSQGLYIARPVVNHQASSPVTIALQ
jgi:hypothetical protein